MIELVNNNVPKRRLNKKQAKREHKSWITKEIKKNIDVQDCLYRKFVKEDNPVIRNNLYLPSVQSVSQPTNHSY